jgi:two-component system OmpR family response regulator
MAQHGFFPAAFMTRVLLIDDDRELSEMLCQYLANDGFEVTACYDGQSGAESAISGDFAIVILDVMMPLVSGIEALRRIRAQSQVPILMLTAKGDDVDRIVGLEMGADDYVPKPCMPRELAARLRAILRRSQPEPAPSTEIIKVGALVLWPQRRSAQWNGVTLSLTGTEFNLLRILALNAGQVVSRKELSEQGLGRALARFDRSIDVHLSSVRHQLGATPDGRPWIQAVRGQGYQLVTT